MQKYSFLLLTAFTLMTSCSQKTVPAATSAGKVNAVSETAEGSATATAPAGSSKMDSFTAAGKNIYISKCGRCHALKAITDYSKQQWIPIMDRMAEKAKLSDTEKTEVLVYVQANAKK
jgi:cytochrome c5